MNISKNASQNNGTAPLVVSAIRYKDPVGKCYGYKGGQVTKAAPHRSEEAAGETLEFPVFADFAAWRKSLTTEYMLTSGTFKAVGEVPVVYKGSEQNSEVSASKNFLAHREQPGILIGDIDFKDSDEVAGLYLGGDQPYKTKEAARGALSKVLPEADGCGLLMGWSTSSNLFKDEKQVKVTGGIRFYIPVTDASKIPGLLDTMHKRSWLKGEGWAYVDGAGKFQERSLVDKALKAATQPDYAAPDLQDGLTQDRDWEDSEGGYLDPYIVTPLTREEEEQYQTAVTAAKEKLAPNMEAQRKAWLAKNTRAHEKQGLLLKCAGAAAIRLLDNGILLPTGAVFFDDGSEVPVLDLLTNGSAHDGKTCKDPVEPNYNGGGSVGRYSWNDGEGPGIHSFAHGSKWYAIKHNTKSAKDTFESCDYDVISLAVAQTEYFSKSEELQLEKLAAKALGLGQSVKPFRADVAEIRKRIYTKGGSDGSDAATDAVIAAGRWPTEKPLPPEIFPAKKGEIILSHADNYKTMMAAYGYGCSYDVIKKEVSWTGPQVDMTTDNAYLALFSRIKGLAALNGLPHGNADLDTHLPAIAEENQINPVRDYLDSLEWDGEDRFGPLARAIGPHDTEVAKIALRTWFTGAAAACEHFETGLKLVRGARPSFEYVLALLGEQGVNKTKGFLGIIPKALGKYAKDGLAIQTSNKDSVKIAVSYWLVELGELDATFGQGQIAQLKAFLSTEADELRLPYARSTSKFKRRTAFIGTVNQDKFLKDATGNRRYLAIECERGFPLWPEDEVDQLWAQAWARYQAGAQWWPTDAEQAILDVNAERFLQHSWAETRIRELFDFTHLKETNKRATATKLWTLLCSDEETTASVRELKPQAQNDLRAAMKKLWGENGAYKKDGEQLIKTARGVVKTYADSGANKGWLLPMTFDESAKEDERSAKKGKEEAEGEVAQHKRVELVKTLSANILAGAEAVGENVSPENVRRQVLLAVKDEPTEPKGEGHKTPTESWIQACETFEGQRPIK